MARKRKEKDPTLSPLKQAARNVRRQAERRIARLDKVIESETASPRMKRLAVTEKYELKKAMFGTKLAVNIGGKRVIHDAAIASASLEELKKAVAEVSPRFTLEGDSFEITQRELNRASVNAPSVYTKKETRIIYRATQHIWQREGVSEHERNEAILNYVNNQRKQNGLSPLSFDKIIDIILAANEKFEGQQNVDPKERMNEEQEERYAQAQKGDTSDHDITSPITETAVQNIIDALDNLVVMPDFTVV